MRCFCKNSRRKGKRRQKSRKETIKIQKKMTDVYRVFDGTSRVTHQFDYMGRNMKVGHRERRKNCFLCNFAIIHHCWFVLFFQIFQIIIISFFFQILHDTFTLVGSGWAARRFPSKEIVGLAKGFRHRVTPRDVRFFRFHRRRRSYRSSKCRRWPHAEAFVRPW